jgi:uncharacterized protein (UPF0248 family)
MKHARDVLNEIKWRYGRDLAETVIYYIDRVRPELGFIEGERIKSWDKSFIYTETDSAIPFHRVERIKHRGREVYSHKR